MQTIERNGYTEQEVFDALHAKKGFRELSFRYDLLDKNDVKVSELTTVVDAEVSVSSLANIKRTAKFTIRDDGNIDWLSDRIQPWARLRMPELKRKHNNYALNFNILNSDKVVLPNVSSLRPPTITIEAWANAASLESWMGIANCKTDASDGINLQFGTEQNIAALIGDGATYSYIKTSWAPKLNEWYHVAVVHDGITNDNFLYVNGNLEATLNKSLSYNSNKWEIGTFYLDSNLFWNGSIDNVRIWNRVLSQEEIQANMNAYLNGNEPGLVGQWRFNEGSGTIAKDSTSNGNDGTINGATYVKNGIEIETVPAGYAEFPLGIFLLSSPTRKDGTENVYRDVDAFDGLQVLLDDKFTDRYHIHAGTRYYDAVISILQSAGITKWNIEQSDKTLQVDIEFEPGKEKLYAINELLGQINYVSLRHDVYGFYTSLYYVSPSTRTSEYTYIDDKDSIIIKGMEETLDLFSVPNKFVVVMSNSEQSPLTSIYTNDNANSLTSTVNRGRTIVDYRTVDNVADQNSLDGYTQRIAFNASQIYGTLTFETAINPIHDIDDVFQIQYSPLEINDKYSETKWSMNLKAGSTMKHEARRVVSI